MSDFPVGPKVPEPGAPNYVDPNKDVRSNHPALDQTAENTTQQDWDMTPAIAHLLQNTAEREGISVDEAMRQLKAGCDDASTTQRPRREDFLGEAGWAKWQSDRQA